MTPTSSSKGVKGIIPLLRQIPGISEARSRLVQEDNPEAQEAGQMSKKRRNSFEATAVWLTVSHEGMPLPKYIEGIARGTIEEAGNGLIRRQVCCHVLNELRFELYFVDDGCPITLG